MAIVALSRIGAALNVGCRKRASRSSLATLRSTGTTPSRKQAVRKVSGDVGLALAAVEVAAGRLDRQRQRATKLAKPLPFQAGQSLP